MSSSCSMLMSIRLSWCEETPYLNAFSTYALLSGGESEKVMMAVGTSVTEKFARGPSLSDEPREKDCEKEQKQGRPVSFFAEN